MAIKLTKTQLKRNKVYGKISEVEFEDYEVIGHVKQGLLLRDKDKGQDVVIKTIFKKSKVDYENEKLERPTEQPKDEDEKEDK